MTTRQPLRHLTLKHTALIKERLGHVAASHPKQFFILPGFFAQLIGSKRGRVVAMATKNLIIFQQELFPVESQYSRMTRLCVFFLVLVKIICKKKKENANKSD